MARKWQGIEVTWTGILSLCGNGMASILGEEMQKLKPKDRFKIVKGDIEYEFEVAEEGGYTVSVPGLPGCLSEGDTFEQTLAMIQERWRAGYTSPRNMVIRYPTGSERNASQGMENQESSL